jgi:hypothetical protein
LPSGTEIDEDVCPACGLTVKIIPDGQSPVRFVQMLQGEAFRPLSGYDEARNIEDAYVFFEGDWGGQIYLVCPMRRVRCSEKALQEILLEIDRRQWKDAEGAAIYYERHRPGDGIWGGMGGGRALDELWIHPALARRSLRGGIRDALEGGREPQRIGWLRRSPRNGAGD